MSAFEVVQGPEIHLVPRVWEWCKEFRSRVFDDYAPDCREVFVANLQARLLEAACSPYWVLSAGDVGGLVICERARPGVWSSHLLFKKAFFGHSITLESVRQAYTQFFRDNLECRRIESLVFSDNSAIIGLARKLGARDEGTMREYTMRGGKPADMVSLGLLRSEFKG